MRVAILGCGYVGLALANELVDDGHAVVGVRRSNETAIADVGAEPVIGDLTDAATLERVPDVDALVFAASSGGGDAETARAVYVEGLWSAIEHFAGRDDPPERLIYTSSTGVYGDHGGDWVDEDTPLDPQTPKTGVLAEAERIARGGSIPGTVARIAGIYGPERWGLERYLERPVTAGYRNHIHRDDVAGALAHLLTHDEVPDTILLVDDEPVDRWTFADWLAAQLGRDPPEKRTVAERLEAGDVSERTERRLRTSKRCRNDRLRELGYAFTYPTYREGYAEAIRART